jgi:hypothetical protein
MVMAAVCKAKGTERKDIPWARGRDDLGFCKEQLQLAGFSRKKSSTSKWFL